MLRFAGIAIIILSFAAASPVAASGLITVEPGIFKIDFDDVDALLGLAKRTDVHVLIVDASEAKRVSDAHVEQVRDWVTRGGVLWAVEDGLKSVFVEKLAGPTLRRFDYKKTGTGKRGGELVVRGESPRLVIHDLPLARNVKQLYLFPKHRFNGTPDAQPLVEMTDEQGNQGLVLALVPVGRGLVFLDGTARSRKRLPFGRLPGFDPDHPNSVKLEGVWRDYDWPKLVASARERAKDALR